MSFTGEAKALALAFVAALSAAFTPLGALAIPVLAAAGLWAASSGTTSGELTLDQPLTLSTTVLGGGDTLSGKVTYRNRTGQPVTLERLTIAVRAPGGTNSGGPFFDLAPTEGPVTLAPGEAVTLSASRALPRDAALGAWRAYPTTEDPKGGWRDGNEVGFEVASPLPASASTAPGPAFYTVRGNQILDPSGQPHLFHGVDRPSLEWSASGEHLSAGDYELMASWGANVVRIAMNQDFWLKGSASYDPTYAARIDQQIAWAHAAGLDVILDLHWSDLGNLADEKPGQQPMADENSLELWREVALRYKNDPHVSFELYNEPHDVSWDTWLHGGQASDGAGGSFQAVGMQQLTDAVRSTGARNLVLVGGLDWAYDLSGVPSHTVEGANVVYVSHTYAGSEHAPSDWDSSFGFLAASAPVVVTEFGSRDGKGDYDQAFVDYAKKKGISWTAWAWFPGGPSFPSIVTDWNGTPNAAGQVVRAALESFAPKSAAAPTAGTAAAPTGAGAASPTPAKPASNVAASTPTVTPGFVGDVAGLGR